MAATLPGFEQAGELKIGQVGIANLRVRTLDVDKLVAEMRERVERAPKLFARAAVVVDFGHLSKTPDAASARALLDGLREAGVLPVALAYGTSAIEALSVELGLPLLAKFRAQYESTSAAAQDQSPPPSPARRSASAAQSEHAAPFSHPTPPPSSHATAAASASPSPRGPQPAAAATRSAADAPSAGAQPAAGPAAVSPGLVHPAPVRSGQQVYAQSRDLTVLATVGAGAEVIADGSIHVYGALRGRALAGAQGDAKARIFCREFHAELVAIAGHYKVLEDLPKELSGKAVQVWLEGEQIKFAVLD